MEKRNYVLGYALLAIGIVIAGWMMSRAVIRFKESERVVTVKGLSEREVPADKVIWPLVYKEVGNNLTELYSTIEATNKKIIDFLVSNGIDRNDISVAPSNLVDLQADRYNSQPYKFRYNVTQAITVTSRNVELVRNLMSRQGDLLKQGIAITADDYRYSTQFLFTSDALNGIKPEMIVEATKNARNSAEKFANDSNSKLGKIKWANQGQFSISNRDENSPQIKVVRVVTTIEYYLKD